MLRLLRAQARRDRLQLIIWILGTSLFGVASGSAVIKEFGDAKGRESLLQLAAFNPALLAIRGTPDGSSTGAVIGFELFTYLAVLAALMSTFLVVRHSRADEEAGRWELLRSTPIGRASALTATVILGVLANLAIAVLLTLGFTATGLPFGGSLLIGLATGGAGIAFVGVAALAAQVAKTGRVANTIAGLGVALAWLLRALGDALGTPAKNGLHVTSAWPSWLSPIGWGQQAHPFGQPQPWILLLDLALFAVTASAAFAIVRQRDLGAGLVGDRQGRDHGRVGSSFGLAWRLQRGGVIAWAGGAAVLGLFAGGLAKPAIDAIKGNPSVAVAVEALAGKGGSLLETFVAAIMAFLGVLAAGAALQAVLRTRSEESDGHTELLLAGRGGPGRSLTDALGIAVISLLVVAAVGGLAAGAALAGAGHPELFWPAVGAAFVQLPAAAIFTAVAALVFAVLPRATVPLGWSLLALGFLLGQFGSLFKLPKAVRDISPFTHTPAAPGAHIDWAPLLVMTAIAVVVAVFATAVSRRRDLVS
ncbi:MAG: polyketide antibiotic transporter [Actinomycetota bacterium]